MHKAKNIFFSFKKKRDGPRQGTFPYYIISKFPFLYVGLRITIKDIFELVREKKNLVGKKPGFLNCLTNRHSAYGITCETKR